MGDAMATQGTVVLWKAPQSGLDGARELVGRFDPQLYPGNGPYFTTDKSLAESYERHYRAGLQEINLTRADFEDLLSRGIVLQDPMYPAGISYHVPPGGLAEFNAAIQRGIFHS